MASAPTDFYIPSSSIILFCGSSIGVCVGTGRLNNNNKLLNIMIYKYMFVSYATSITIIGFRIEL